MKWNGYKLIGDKVSVTERRCKQEQTHTRTTTGFSKFVLCWVKQSTWIKNIKEKSTK